MEVMAVTMCFYESLMSQCALKKLNSIKKLYILLPWLQVLEGGVNFLTKKKYSENQDFHPYPSQHMPT